MNEEKRPDPEELLRAVTREEQRTRRGKLKIFLGMAAGVGKTYAMLQAARTLAKEGVDVVVGTVYTHGRHETAEMLLGLKLIPEKWVHYKDSIFEELDIDQILSLKPQLVVIDELAHSNIPGCRHSKRWQDVVEILDNGIDVYTTLNVQHIESLKDDVENIAGITIRETVPDVIIESAADIELVDITPVELLERLKAGKVYLGDQSETAARHFFQEDRITALREIALRYTAEKVEHDLHGMVSRVGQTSVWRSRERILVAVSHSPHSQKLIRTARQIAFKLDAAWIALHVDDGRILNESDSMMLAKNLAMANELGAEVVTTYELDIAHAISRVAREKKATQILIGRHPKGVLSDLFPSFTPLGRLTNECRDIDVHILRQLEPAKPAHGKISYFSTNSPLSHYIATSSAVVLLSLTNWFFTFDVFGYEASGFFFIIFILLLSLFFRKGPILFASILYALIWELFFIPARGLMLEDAALFILFLLTAMVSAVLIDRSRTQQEMLRKREKSAQALYDIVRDITSIPSSEQIFSSVKKKLGALLYGTCEIYTKSSDNLLNFPEGSPIAKDEKEKAAAQWVFANGKEAGWSTFTLPSVRHLFTPLKGFHETVGVLAFLPNKDNSLSIDEKNFLYTAGHQLALHLERTITEEKARKHETLKQIDTIHKGMLQMLYQQLEQPQKAIHKSIEKLKIDDAAIRNIKLHHQISNIEKKSQYLLKTLENISTMGKLSAGLVPLRKELHNVENLLSVCVGNIRKEAVKQKIKVDCQKDLPMVTFDVSLIESLVSNLIYNAIENSPSDSTIEIEAKIANDYLVISVSDEGKGIPEEMLNDIFDQFFRLPEATASGLGLGLSIAKAIANIHHADLKAYNREKGGARFSLYLPLA